MQLLTSQKKILGPVHLHSKTDKWDYLWSPIMKKKIVSYFDIGEVPRSPGRWDWNWLYFLPFIFTFEQGALQTNCNCSKFFFLLGWILYHFSNNSKEMELKKMRNWDTILNVIMILNIIGEAIPQAVIR